MASDTSPTGKKKLKFLCSFGGKILPRPKDRKLRYVGGNTKIIRISQDTCWEGLKKELMTMCDQPHTIKYQLPRQGEGEDFDFLLSVACDKDLQNMMEHGVVEIRGSRKLLRTYLFPLGDNGIAHLGMDGDSRRHYLFAVNGIKPGARKPSDWDQLLNPKMEVQQHNESGVSAESTEASVTDLSCSDAVENESGKSLAPLEIKGADLCEMDPQFDLSEEMQQELSTGSAFSDYGTASSQFSDSEADLGDEDYMTTSSQFSDDEANIADLHHSASLENEGADLVVMDSQVDSDNSCAKRVFHSEPSNPRAQAELLSHLKEADIPAGAQYVILQSQSRMVSPESIAEATNRLHESGRPSAPRTQHSSPAALEDGLLQYEKEEKLANSVMKSHKPKHAQAPRGSKEVESPRQPLMGHEPLPNPEVHARQNQTDISVGQNNKVGKKVQKTELHHSALASPDDKGAVGEPLLDGREAADLAITPISTGASVSLLKVEEGIPSPHLSDPQRNDRADLIHIDSQIKFGGEMQQRSSSSIEGGAHGLHPVYIPSRAQLLETIVESVEVENTSQKVEENLGAPSSQHQESTIEESSGLLVDSSGRKIDISNMQVLDNKDLEVQKELGFGGFGTVYHGKWKGIDVAIKRIKKSSIAGQHGKPELILESLREAGILSNLHHPHIVSLYGCALDELGGSVAIVTELVVNGSLRNIFLREDKYLDHRKRLIIAKGAASGMEYLHFKNIVHFDLKCDNLLVDLKDSSQPICKVCDFGLSKIKRNTLVTGGFRGTVPWMAPELLKRGRDMVSEKVDVFSFGIVMWELITGEVPYNGMDEFEIRDGVSDNSLRPLVPASCDTEWRKLMEECWASDPQQRPSFSEIVVRLHSMFVTTLSKG